MPPCSLEQNIITLTTPSRPEDCEWQWPGPIGMSNLCPLFFGGLAAHKATLLPNCPLLSWVEEMYSTLLSRRIIC